MIQYEGKEALWGKDFFIEIMPVLWGVLKGFGLGDYFDFYCLGGSIQI